MQLTALLPIALAAFAAAVPTEQAQPVDRRGFNSCNFPKNMGTKAGLIAAAKTLAARPTDKLQIAEPVVLATAVVNGQKTTISAYTVVTQGSPGFYWTTYQELAEYALNVIDQCSFLNPVTLNGQPDRLVAGLYSPNGDKTWLEIEVSGDYNGPVSR